MDGRWMVSGRLTKRRSRRLDVASMGVFLGEESENFVSVVRAGAGRRAEGQRARLVQKERRKARRAGNDDELEQER